MANRLAVSERVSWAASRLAACQPTSAVVTEMTARWGCSRRQSRRLVARAHQQLVDDLEVTGVERVHMVAQLHAALMTAMATALSRNQPAVVVGASRALMDLLQLSPTRRSL